jgi:type II secretory pathway pseudopilin PulG
MYVMRKALSIAELIIVACIIGILAALVVPMIADKAIDAKAAAAQDNLRMLRSTIKLYAARHAGVAPGYENNDYSAAISSEIFLNQTTVIERYMRKMPVNPFNNLRTIRMVADGAPLPPSATGDYGWFYKPSTETIRLDWPGQDSKGVRYYDY